MTRRDPGADTGARPVRLPVYPIITGPFTHKTMPTPLVSDTAICQRSCLHPGVGRGRTRAMNDTVQAARRGGQRGSGSGSGLMRVRAARMRAAAPARSVAARAASASSSRRA